MDATSLRTPLSTGSVQTQSNIHLNPTSTTAERSHYIDGPFACSGFEPDILLNLAISKRVIDENGRIVFDLFEIKTELKDEIQAVAKKLLIDYEDSAIVPNIKFNPPPDLPIQFLPTIFGLQAQLRQDTPPEIIGGAVGHLLGENFFIQYLVKRLGIPEEQAKELLAPLIVQIRKRPADIDCRQYVKNANQNKIFKDQDTFRSEVSKLVHNLIPKKEILPQVTPNTIRQSYFFKLFLVPDQNKKFGIAGFGQFLGGAPLEYLIVDSLDRPFISFQNSTAIVIEKPAPGTGNTPIISLKFYSKQTDRYTIVHETSFFQKAALLLDGTDLAGIDWRGVLSSMAEATRAGYRTLNKEFFQVLWTTFKESKEDLWKRIEWAIKNHIKNRGEPESVEAELEANYYWNLFIFLIDQNDLPEEVLSLFLQKIKSSEEPLQTVHQILKIKNLDFKTKISWIRIALWINLGNGVSRGSLSTNYGELCHRFTFPHSNSTLWLRVGLSEAIDHAIESIKTPNPSTSLDILLLLLSQLIESGKNTDRSESLPLVKFSQWIDASKANELALLLRKNKQNPNGLKLALAIDHLLHSQKAEDSFPDEWLLLIPELVQSNPESRSQLTPLFQEHGNPQSLVPIPSIDVMQSTSRWIGYLIASRRGKWIDYGIRLISGLEGDEKVETVRAALASLIDRVDHFLKLYNQVYKELEKSIQDLRDSFIFNVVGGLVELPADQLKPQALPWLLFIFHFSGGTKKGAVRREGNQYVLQFGEGKDKKSLYFNIAFISEGLKYFEQPENQNSCIELFNATFEKELPQISYSVIPETERALLVKATAQLMAHPRETPAFRMGLLLHLHYLSQPEKRMGPVAELLKEFPFLRKLSPLVGKALGKALSVANDTGSKLLKRMLTTDKKFQKHRWIVALLCHAKKECTLLGSTLLKELDQQSQETLWHDHFNDFLQYRWQSIAGIMATFDKIKFTLDSHHNFVTAWVKNIKSNPKESQQKTEISNIKKQFPELSKIQKLQRVTAKPISWLNALEEVLKERNSKPQLPQPSQPVTPPVQSKGKTGPQNSQKSIFDEAKKIVARGTDQDIASFFISLNKDSMAQNAFDTLLQPKIYEMKLSLFQMVSLALKFRYMNPAYWMLILSKMAIETYNIKNSKELDRTLALFRDDFSKENEYGKVFWSDPSDNTKQIWGLLVAKVLGKYLAIPFEEFARRIDSLFPDHFENNPLQDSFLTAIALKFSFKVNQLEIADRAGTDQTRSAQNAAIGHAYIASCDKKSAEEIFKEGHEFCFHLWNVYRSLRKDPIQILSEFMSKDPTGKKAILVTKFLGVFSLSYESISLHFHLKALYILQGKPGCKIFALNSLRMLFQCLGIGPSLVLQEDQHQTVEFLKQLLKLLLTPRKTQNVSPPPTTTLDDLLIYEEKFQIRSILYNLFRNPSIPHISDLIKKIEPIVWFTDLISLFKEIPPRPEDMAPRTVQPNTVIRWSFSENLLKKFVEWKNAAIWLSKDTCEDEQLGQLLTAFYLIPDLQAKRAAQNIPLVPGDEDVITIYAMTFFKSSIPQVHANFLADVRTILDNLHSSILSIIDKVGGRTTVQPQLEEMAEFKRKLLDLVEQRKPEQVIPLLLEQALSPNALLNSIIKQTNSGALYGELLKRLHEIQHMPFDDNLIEETKKFERILAYVNRYHSGMVTKDILHSFYLVYYNIPNILKCKLLLLEKGKELELYGEGASRFQKEHLVLLNFICELLFGTIQMKDLANQVFLRELKHIFSLIIRSPTPLAGLTQDQVNKYAEDYTRRALGTATSRELLIEIGDLFLEDSQFLAKLKLQTVHISKMISGKNPSDLLESPGLFLLFSRYICFAIYSEDPTYVHNGLFLLYRMCDDLVQKRKTNDLMTYLRLIFDPTFKDDFIKKHPEYKLPQFIAPIKTALILSAKCSSETLGPWVRLITQFYAEITNSHVQEKMNLLIKIYFSLQILHKPENPLLEIELRNNHAETLLHFYTTLVSKDIYKIPFNLFDYVEELRQLAQTLYAQNYTQVMGSGTAKLQLDYLTFLIVTMPKLTALANPDKPTSAIVTYMNTLILTPLMQKNDQFFKATLNFLSLIETENLLPPEHCQVIRTILEISRGTLKS